MHGRKVPCECPASIESTGCEADPAHAQARGPAAPSPAGLPQQAHEKLNVGGPF